MTKTIKKPIRFSPVNIAFASNEGYAEPLAASVYSLLLNGSKSRLYDIIIMHKDITSESINKFRLIEKAFPNCSIRFIDVSELDESVSSSVCSYFTSEANYRLFLFGEMFAEYDRMIYLDCDTVVTGDISELFDISLEGNAAGAVEAIEGRYYSHSKKAVFYNKTPYNFDDYRRKILGLKNIQNYFNSGMILLDLKKCREITSAEAAVELLNSKPFIYNDQDTLNIIFKDSLKMLDLKWNYTINIEQSNESPNPIIRKLYEGTRRTDYRIIHYVSGRKPWNADVPLGEYYHKYQTLLKEDILCQQQKEEN